MVAELEKLQTNMPEIDQDLKAAGSIIARIRNGGDNNALVPEIIANRYVWNIINTQRGTERKGMRDGLSSLELLELYGFSCKKKEE